MHAGVECDVFVKRTPGTLRSLGITRIAKGIYATWQQEGGSSMKECYFDERKACDYGKDMEPEEAAAKGRRVDSTR